MAEDFSHAPWVISNLYVLNIGFWALFHNSLHLTFMLTLKNKLSNMYMQRLYQQNLMWDIALFQIYIWRDYAIVCTCTSGLGFSEDWFFSANPSPVFFCCFGNAGIDHPIMHCKQIYLLKVCLKCLQVIGPCMCRIKKFLFIFFVLDKWKLLQNIQKIVTVIEFIFSSPSKFGFLIHAKWQMTRQSKVSVQG